VTPVATVRRALLLTLPLLLAGACASAPRAHPWLLLGQRVVDFHVDHDVIEVGRSEGRFRELRFVAHQGVVEMYDVRITLGDGDRFRPEGKLVLDRGEGRTVNLPGDLRRVRNVQFVYRSLRGAGQRATISLYGR
jgi:hypothetical protein